MRHVFVAGTVVALAALSASAHSIMFDNFTEGAATLTLDGVTGSIEGQQSGVSIAGTQRDAWLLINSNPFSQMARFVVTGTSQGAAFYNGDTGTQGFVQLDYDGIDNEGNDGVQTAGPGMSMILTGQTGFQVNFLSADSPVRVDIMAVTYGATDLASIGTFTTAANISSPTSYTVNFADMAIAGGSTEAFRPSDVDRFVIRFTPVNPSGDFAIASIGTVPEPASFAILAAGCAGIFRMRRRSKK